MFLFKKRKKIHKDPEGRVVLTLKDHAIDTVLDIGANIGQTGEKLREWGFEGDIISIEPLNSLQSILLEKSKNDPRWQILPPLALGDEEKEITINISEGKDMSSILDVSEEMLTALPDSKVIGTQTVQMTTLDRLYDDLKLENKNVFIKMDTQGYEMNILKHGNKALQKAKGLRLEMSLFEVYKGETTCLDIMNFLHQAGYSPYLLWEIYFSRKLNRQFQLDGVFYKN